MKTKAQKVTELNKGKELLGNTQSLLFIDCSKVQTKDLVKLRRELKEKGNPLVIMKKRLVGLLLKEKGMDPDMKQFKTSVGTVFVSNLESAAASVYTFFRGLEKEKKIDSQKILGGYDLAKSESIDAKQVIYIGQLPPREVLLGQLLGMIAAPIKSFLYLLDQKANAGGEK